MRPPREHAFHDHPHRTLVGLALPVLVSLVAEPLTGVVDTAFVSRLGANSVAALGVATILLSSLFWVFNFLGIGTQTSVAKALGAGDAFASRAVTSSSAATALVLGAGVALLVLPFLGALVTFMGADGPMRDQALPYLQIRLLGAPAILVTLASFGALRGLQDMKTPLWIAVGLNGMNIGLDAILIFGWGVIPAFGLPGAAAATVISQWFGATAAFFAARRRIGGGAVPSLREIRELFVVGRDLFLRTGLLLVFLLLGTRAATLTGTAEAAAHQAVRQIWMLGAFLLDAWAASAQSLVGFFFGAGEYRAGRRVAGVACGWAFLSGVALMVLMLLTEVQLDWLLVPPESRSAFLGVFWIAAISQPINALSFVTDGIHWGAGDYRYLRNVMLLATASGAVGLLLLRPGAPSSFEQIWWITFGWITIRAAFGIARVWPGIGRAPLRAEPPLIG